MRIPDREQLSLGLVREEHLADLEEDYSGRLQRAVGRWGLTIYGIIWWKGRGVFMESR
jgi:hypothetical protein